MTIMVNKLGWMAGVIDLKGRIIRKQNKMRATQQIVLAVETREIPVIRELGSMTGTSPELIKAKPIKEFMRMNCREHCPEPHIHVFYNEFGEELKMPAVARWTITGAGMVVVLHNILPYLLTDRGYIEAMANARDNTTLVGQGAGATLSSLRRLYHIGWDMPDDYKEAVEVDP